MKTSRVVIGAVAIGIISGAALSWAEYGSTPEFTVRDPLSLEKSQAAKTPKVTVPVDSHDFGAVERGIKVRHGFRVLNTGKAPLTLEAAGTTCSKCTIAEIKKGELAPGESTEVVVEYSSNYGQSNFRQTATVSTNDPERPRIELNIFGIIASKYRVIPEEVILTKVSSGESRNAVIRGYSYTSPSIRVHSHEFTDAGTAEYFEFAEEPIPADQLTEPNAKSGCKITLTVKPGLPLGAIRQKIRLAMQVGDSDEYPEIEIPIYGNVVSDISVIGSGWNGDYSLLSINEVNGAQGAKRNLVVLVRGDHRDAVTVEPVSASPDWLKTTLGEPSKLNDSVIQIPLTIEIPPGTPPANHLGSEQGKYAKIVLKVNNHPHITEIPLYLKFLIE